MKPYPDRAIPGGAYGEVFDLAVSVSEGEFPKGYNSGISIKDATDIELGGVASVYGEDVSELRGAFHRLYPAAAVEGLISARGKHRRR